MPSNGGCSRSPRNASNQNTLKLGLNSITVSSHCNQPVRAKTGRYFEVAAKNLRWSRQFLNDSQLSFDAHFPARV